MIFDNLDAIAPRRLQLGATGGTNDDWQLVLVEVPCAPDNSRVYYHISFFAFSHPGRFAKKHSRAPSALRCIAIQVCKCTSGSSGYFRFVSFMNLRWSGKRENHPSGEIVIRSRSLDCQIVFGKCTDSAATLVPRSANHEKNLRTAGPSRARQSPRVYRAVRFSRRC